MINYGGKSSRHKVYWWVRIIKLGIQLFYHTNKLLANRFLAQISIFGWKYARRTVVDLRSTPLSHLTSLATVLRTMMAIIHASTIPLKPAPPFSSSRCIFILLPSSPPYCTVTLIWAPVSMAHHRQASDLADDSLASTNRIISFPGKWVWAPKSYLSRMY
jgi:hypothetical protein